MFTTMRVVIAAIVFIFIAAFRATRERSRAQTPIDWSKRRAAVVGILMVAVALAGLAEGASRLGAGFGSILSNLSPLVVVAFGFVGLGRRSTPIAAVAAVVGFVGVAVMMASRFGQYPSHTELALGATLAIAGTTAWALGTVLMKDTLDDSTSLDLVSYLTWQHVVAAVVLVLLVLLFSLESVDWTSLELWGAAIWTGIGASVAASLLFVIALDDLPAVTVSVAQLLIPALAVLIDISLGERFGLVTLLGMGLALGAVAAVSLDNKKVAPVSALGMKAET